MGQWGEASGFDTLLPSASTLVSDGVSETERTDSILAKSIRIAGISLSGSVITILIIGIILFILFILAAIFYTHKWWLFRMIIV